MTSGTRECPWGRLERVYGAPWPRVARFAGAERWRGSSSSAVGAPASGALSPFGSRRDGDDVVIIGRRGHRARRGSRRDQRDMREPARSPRSSQTSSEPDQVDTTAKAIAAGGLLASVVNNAGGNCRRIAERRSPSSRTAGGATSTGTCSRRCCCTEALEPALATARRSDRDDHVDRGAPRRRVVRRGQGGAPCLDDGPRDDTCTRRDHRERCAPGFIPDTELLGGQADPGDRRACVLRSHRSGRPGTPEEVAEAVAYLASPTQASPPVRSCR